MFLYKIFILFLIFPSMTLAKPVTKTKVKKTAPSRTSHWGAQFLHWQERLDGHDSTSAFKMTTQTIAVGAGITWDKIWDANKRFITSYPVYAYFGMTDAFGDSGTTEHNLKGQKLLGLKFDYAIRYRTSSESDIGISIPIFFRYIMWNIEGGPGLQIEGSTGFSGGLALTNRIGLSKRSRLNISVGYQYPFPTALWMFGYEVW